MRNDSGIHGDFPSFEDSEISEISGNVSAFFIQVIFRIVADLILDLIKQAMNFENEMCVIRFPEHDSSIEPPYPQPP